MFMLAGIANRRLPGNTNKLPFFRQMQFSSRLMFMLAGLANPRLHGNPPKIAVFSSNAILVSIYVHAGRPCQPSAARKAKHFCSFRQMQFLSRFMFMLARLANLRLPGNTNILPFFGK
jgi:hypothetical protein